MSRTAITLCVATVFFLTAEHCPLFISASAQVPLQFTYQGRLTDDQGIPVTGIATGMVFQIIKGGDAVSSVLPPAEFVHSETNDVAPDVNGVFKQVLGLGENGNGLIDPADFIDGTMPRWISVVVDGAEMLPRQQLVAVPYSVASLMNLEQTVIARYTIDNTPQTISNNVPTVVNFERKSIDTHNAVTVGSDWTFTAPVSGIYLVQASARFVTSTAWDPTGGLLFELMLNNLRWSVVGFKEAYVASGVANSQTVHGSDVVRMNEGDEFKIKIVQQSGLPLAIVNAPDYNRVSIVRIGL